MINHFYSVNRTTFLFCFFFSILVVFFVDYAHSSKANALSCKRCQCDTTCTPSIGSMMTTNIDNDNWENQLTAVLHYKFGDFKYVLNIFIEHGICSIISRFFVLLFLIISSNPASKSPTKMLIFISPKDYLILLEIKTSVFPPWDKWWEHNAQFSQWIHLEGHSGFCFFFFFSY